MLLVLPKAGPSLRSGGQLNFVLGISTNKDFMRNLLLFVIVVIMSATTMAQSLPVPHATTDPKLVTSKPSAQVEQNEQSLSIERLYMTRAVGSASWSPDG